MTRQRLVPSVQYRSQHQVVMTLPADLCQPKVRITGAARLNDAYGAVAGVGGAGCLPMFEVQAGGSYVSKGCQNARNQLMDTNRGLTRMVFDPDDFATPVQPVGTGYLPGDGQTLFLRVEQWNATTGAWDPPGPIMMVMPYDFFSTKEPVFTVSGQVPDMGLGAWPAGIPDYMPPLSLNFMAPAYSATVSLANLDSTKYLFASFHPGMPPTVIPPHSEFTLTGSGVPEFYLGCPDGNPWFSVRVAVVNGA